MKLIEWFKRRFRKPRRAIETAPGPDTPAPPLREFVYLDEVSLRSLLSSQKGEMTDSTSEESVDALEAEASTTLGANPGLVAKAELASRFQTTNSSTFQTARKATVQSWFRELHRIPGLRLVEVAKPEKPAADIDALASTTDTSLVVSQNALQRGSLVEFRVKLKADPVFHLGTMVSEFSSMAEDYPNMFGADNGLAAIREVRPINKILQRLLAGLIPIRAEAVGYSVVDIGGVEGLVHLSEMSWKRIQKPGDMVQKGDRVKVQILSVDQDRQRVALSMKRLESDPWTRIEELYRVGQLVEAEITRLTKFGAFARVDDDYQLEGLIHISELAEDRVEQARDIVKPGDKITVRIIRLDSKQRQVGLSLRQVASDKFIEEDLAMLNTM